jgi:hypothetical protein
MTSLSVKRIDADILYRLHTQFSQLGADGSLDSVILKSQQKEEDITSAGELSVINAPR